MTRTAAPLAVVALAVVLGGLATPALAAPAAAPMTVLATIPTGPKPQDVVVAPDGRLAYLTTLEDGMLSEIDLTSNTVTRQVRIGSTAGAVIWFDDGLIVADAATPALVFVDPATLAVTRTMPIDGDAIALTSSPVGPDGPIVVYAANAAGSLGIVTGDFAEDDGFLVGGAPWGVDLFDGGARAISADTTNGRVVISDTTLGSGGPMTEVAVGGRPSYIAVAPDESVAYVANADRAAVDVIDLSTFAVAASFDVGGKPWGVAVSWEGDYVYVPDNLNGGVIAVDARTGHVLGAPATGEHPDFVALSPDGTRVLVPNSGSDTLTVLQGYSRPPGGAAPTEDGGTGNGGPGDGSRSAASGEGGLEPAGIVAISAGGVVVVGGIGALIWFLLHGAGAGAAAAAASAGGVAAGVGVAAGLPGPPVAPPGEVPGAIPVGLPVPVVVGRDPRPAIDSEATPEQLAEYALDPAYRPAVAAHPHAYPDLLAWLGTLGEPEVDAALRVRGA